MSCHRYVTTTVEYYEYTTPHTLCYNYESIFRPFPGSISTTDFANPLSCADYSNVLPNDFDELYVMGRTGGHILMATECEQEPELYEYRHQRREEPPCSHYEHDSDRLQVNQPQDVDKDNKTETAATSESTDKKLKKNKKNKNIYQAEQGYIVEEPASEDGQE